MPPLNALVCSDMTFAVFVCSSVVYDLTKTVKKFTGATAFNQATKKGELIAMWSACLTKINASSMIHIQAAKTQCSAS